MKRFLSSEFLWGMGNDGVVEKSSFAVLRSHSTAEVQRGSGGGAVPHPCPAQGRVQRVVPHAVAGYLITQDSSSYHTVIKSYLKKRKGDTFKMDAKKKVIFKYSVLGLCELITTVCY